MYSYVVCTCNATPVCCTAYGLYKFVCQDAGWYTYAFWHNRMQNLKIFLIFNILSQLQHLLSLRHYVLVDFGSIRLVWGQAEHILMDCLALNATRILIIMSTEKCAGLDVFFFPSWRTAHFIFWIWNSRFGEFWTHQGCLSFGTVVHTWRWITQGSVRWSELWLKNTVPAVLLWEKNTVLAEKTNWTS